jgi:hypothetical protein
MSSKAQRVGQLSARVIFRLGLLLPEGQNILLGPSNIAHMKKSHPADYARYGEYIPLILSSPDYVGENPTDGSIEYVREFEIDGAFVKVAVRVSAGGALYARSVYKLNDKRVRNFIAKGTLKKY